MLEFDFSNINEDNRITKEFIESKLSHEEIYCRYLGDVDFRKGVKSPFNADRTPSCKFFVRDNKLFWKDFSSGKSGDVFKLLAELNPTESFPQILERIAKDFGLMNGKNSYTNLVKKTYILPESKPADIKVVPRDWDEATLNYWKQYDIRLETLKLFNVKACQEVWIEDRPFYMYNKNNPAYRYTINKGFKIYQPLIVNKKNKWRNSIKSDAIWGLEQLSYDNDTVFIVSSMKDIMVMKELGFSSVCMNSESCEIPDNLINYLKTKYENVVIFLDSDPAGISFARKCHKRTDCIYLYIPLTEKFKDQSDLVKGTSMIYAKELIMELLNTYVY
jgi:5S rRNA maturation endonuclease (ribonuclease M5)